MIFSLRRYRRIRSSIAQICFPETIFITLSHCLISSLEATHSVSINSTICIFHTNRSTTRTISDVREIGSTNGKGLLISVWPSAPLRREKALRKDPGGSARSHLGASVPLELSAPGTWVRAGSVHGNIPLFRATKRVLPRPASPDSARKHVRAIYFQQHRPRFHHAMAKRRRIASTGAGTCSA